MLGTAADRRFLLALLIAAIIAAPKAVGCKVAEGMAELKAIEGGQ